DPVGRHPADAVVRGVGDEEIARGVYGDAGRGLELGGSRQAAVATEAGPTGAGDGRDDPGVGRHPADAVVVGVGDEEVARGVHGDAGRGLELGGGGGAAVVDGVTPAAGDGRDDPAPSRHLADAVVRRVRDEEVARSVDGDTGRDPQLGAGGGAPIAAEVDITGAGDGGDDPGAAGDPADAVVRRVRDEEVAGGVDGDAARDPQLGAGGGAVVTAEAGVTGAGDRGDDPAAGYDLTDSVVLGVRDEEVAR